MKAAEAVVSERELRELEARYPAGLTAHQILELCGALGAPISEATFRRYVQVGLLPRSRRVGRKGKHRGSQGIYPVGTVRRLATVRGLIAESYTVEEVRRKLARSIEIESMRGELEVVLRGFLREIETPDLDEDRRRVLSRGLADARKQAGSLVQQIESLERLMSASQHKRPTVTEPAPPPQLGGGAG